jgi:Lon protease-like protein
MALPIFPLNTVLFPGIPLPLRVFENRYLRMLADRATLNPIFGISLIESGQEVGGEPTFHRVGTTARLLSINAQGSSRVDIVVVGERRVRVGTGDWASGYAMSDIQDIPDVSYDQEMAADLIANAQISYTRYLTGIANVAGLDFAVPALGEDAASISFEIASRLPLHTWEQQAILEDQDPLSRMQTVCRLLDRELALLYKGGTAGVPIQYPGERFTLN